MNELHGVVRQALDFVCSLQQLNGNLNFLTDGTTGNQVHWNHGAAGAVFLFCKAYQVGSRISIRFLHYNGVVFLTMELLVKTVVIEV